MPTLLGLQALVSLISDPQAALRLLQQLPDPALGSCALRRYLVILVVFDAPSAAKSLLTYSLALRQFRPVGIACSLELATSLATR